MCKLRVAELSEKSALHCRRVLSLLEERLRRHEKLTIRGRNDITAGDRARNFLISDSRKHIRTRKSEIRGTSTVRLWRCSDT